MLSLFLTIYVLAQTAAGDTTSTLTGLVEKFGWPSALLIVIFISAGKYIRSTLSSAERREARLASRLEKLEDNFREKLITLNNTTTTALNANTAAICANTEAMIRLQAQADRNHDIVRRLLDQLIAERCLVGESAGQEDPVSDDQPPEKKKKPA